MGVPPPPDNPMPSSSRPLWGQGASTAVAALRYPRHPIPKETPRPHRTESFPARSVHDQSVEKPVEGLGPREEGGGAGPLHRLGGGVEQAPRGAGRELAVPGPAPLPQGVGELGAGEGLAVEGAHEQVVGDAVADGLAPVGFDPLVETAEVAPELADGAGGEVPQVAHGEAGVLPRDGHLSAEGEVVADEDAAARDESGG